MYGVLANRREQQETINVLFLLVCCTQEVHLESQLLEKPPVLAALISERKQKQHKT